jgi:hypothetical protein
MSRHKNKAINKNVSESLLKSKILEKMKNNPKTESPRASDL